MATVEFTALLEAFELVSTGGPCDSRAYVDRETGAVRCASYVDIGNYAGDRWLPLPHRNQLELGRGVPLAFLAEHLPEERDRVRGWFLSLGGWSRFRALLRERQALALWARYRHRATTLALRAWCERMGLELRMPPAVQNQLPSLAGRWHGREEMIETRWGPAGYAQIELAAHARFDGRMLVQDWVARRDSAAWVQAHAVLSFDAESARYDMHWFDSSGYVPARPADGHWDGTSLRFEQPTLRGLRRFSLRPLGVARMATRMERSADHGATWATVAHGEYARL